MTTNENALSFCPHCGEDIRMLTQPAPAQTDPQKVEEPAKKVIIRREVTRQEIEALWGLMPLPFGTRPVGVVVKEGTEVPLSLAAEGKDGMVELRTGQTKQLGVNAGVTEPQLTKQPTVPEHFCSNTVEQREKEGAFLYGGKK